MENFTIKDFIVDVMLKPLPGVLLKSAIQAGAIYLATTGIFGIVTAIYFKLKERRASA